MKAVKIVLLVGLLAAILATPGFAVTNLLTNPSFESGPFGEFTGVPYAPTGWTQGPEHNTATYNWHGVYDSTWKNPVCNPAWPDPVHQPVDGSYFIGAWLAPQSGCDWHPGVGGGIGYIMQTLNNLDPGKYYFSVWAATNHPHGAGLARIVALPQNFDGTAYNPPLHQIYPINTPFMDADPVPTYASTGRVAAPAETKDLTTWPYYSPNWANCDERWRKLTCEVTIGENQNACTVFLAHLFTSNNLAEPQYAQMDAARFATAQTLEIKNVQITSINPKGATIEWDIRDGDNWVKVADTKTRVKYGTTTTYGSTVDGQQLDANYCNGTTPGRPGHYTAILSGLTTGSQYHFCIEVDAGEHTYVEPWRCDDGSTIIDGQRLYDGAVSSDQFPLVPGPLINISTPTVTNITKDSATISWTTDVAATSQVNYGMFGTINQSKSDLTPKTSHSITLTGLANNTSYSYNVKATAQNFSDTTTTVKTFNTLLGPNIMNGDFEFDAHNGAKAKYWTDIPMWSGPNLRLNGEFSIPSHGGNWHCGMITSGSATHNFKGIYQQVATVPGDIISVYAWSFANGQSAGDGITGAPHRFGELNNQIGIDPTGAKMGTFGFWLSSTIWGGQLSSTDWHVFQNDMRGWKGGYRRLGLCAVAESDKATIYLRTRSWFGNNWLFNSFDDVTIEAPTPVQSVGAMKALPMQTNVNLTQGDYVVTYVQPFNVNADENGGQPYFYIQDRNKGGAGIKVTIAQRSNWPSWLDDGVGKKVNIIGTLDWGVFNNLRFGNLDQQARLDKPAGEMVLRAVKITDTGLTASLPEPVGVTNFSLGGGSSADPYFTNAGVDGGSGANNVGMRVRTWGKIVEMGTDASGFIYMIVDDGSRLPVPPAAPMSVNDVLREVTYPDGSKKLEPGPGTMIQTSKISDYQHQPGLYVQTWDPIWPVHDDWTDVAVGDYVILTGISGVRLDLDTDDHQCLVTGADPQNPDIIPEAEKNMRTIKLETGGAKYFKL